MAHTPITETPIAEAHIDETPITDTHTAPRLIVHADWGSTPGKRWVCRATPTDDGGYEAHAPELAGDPGTLLSRLLGQHTSGVLLGFDFPIGLPVACARRIGVSRFPDFLRAAGSGAFAQFFELARTADEISLHRPFYPHRPGGTSRAQLTNALGIPFAQLLRTCDHRTVHRNAASALFWTLGSQQVGRAAIHGWRDVLQPALADAALDVALWPFDGTLHSLLATREVVIAEAYPAEAAVHLGLNDSRWSKRDQTDRARLAQRIRSWSTQHQITLTRELLRQLEAGFGRGADGEDRFDAVLGALSMCAVATGRGASDHGLPHYVRDVEGWIIGQPFDSEPSSPSLSSARVHEESATRAP
jgi:hypothetical protein